MLIVLLVIITIPATALLFLQNSKIQTQLTSAITRQLSQSLGTEIKIKNVSITFFNRFQLKDVYIQDLNKDTLLFSKKVKVTVKKFNRGKQSIEINHLTLDGADIHLISTDSTGVNLSFIIERLKNPDKAESEKWNISFNNIRLENSRFRFSNPHKESKGAPIDFNAMDLSDLNVNVNNLEIIGDTVGFDIYNLNFHEKSGFRVNNLNSRMIIAKNLMHFNNTYIETARSAISANSLHFNFETFKDFKDFVNLVDLEFNLRSTSVDFADITYFSRGLNKYSEKFRISGLFSGTISQMSASKILLSYNDHTLLGGSFNLIGLPNIKETFMHFNIEMFQTNIEDLRKIKLPGIKKFEIPDNLSRLGTITYIGKFTGYYDDFVAYGKFGTDLGDFSTDLLLKPDTTKGTRYMGRVRTGSFQLGEIAPDYNDIIGNISVSANVDGKTVNQKISANLKGRIDSLQIYGYNYKNINLSGFLSDRVFDGSLDITDPNIQMKFLGKVDFSTERPNFNFTADVGRLRPYYLNVNKTDPSYFASFLIKSDFNGIHPDSLNGSVNLVNSFFQHSDDQIQIYDFSVEAKNSADASSLIIRSDVMDADIIGNYSLSSISQSFRNLVTQYLPSLNKDSALAQNKSKDYNTFDFKIEFKKIKGAVEFFTRDYLVEDNSSIAGTYDASSFETKLSAHFPGAGYKNNNFNNLFIIATTDSLLTEFNLVSSEFRLNNDMHINNMNLNGEIYNDTLYTRLGWGTDEVPMYRGDLRFLTGIDRNSSSGNQQVHIESLPSYIIFNDTIWNIGRSQIEIDSSYFSVDTLIFSNQNQSVIVAGEVSGSSDSNLSMSFNNLDLTTFNVFTRKINLDFAGFISGKASLINPYNNPLFLSDLSMAELFVNGQDFGTGELRAKWDKSSNSIHMLASGVKGGAEIFRIEGDYFPEGKNMDFDIDFDKIRLSTFEPFAERLVSDIKGLGTGSLSIGGSADMPSINGAIDFFKASMIVNYLQTRYYFTDAVEINDNNIQLSGFNLTDEEGNGAVAEGLIRTEYFKNFNISLNINTPEFLFLNTTPADNELFYGRVIASGIVKINGPPENLVMDINARTDKNSTFSIPLNGTEEVNESDFIRFVNTEKQPGEKEDEDIIYSVNTRGLNMNFNLEITPEAEVQLIFDPTVGDILRGRGNGNLRMAINTTGEFEMFGEMTIEEGSYLFTLQNIINKRLEVEPGGRITFNGDPSDADINLKAVYKLRTSVYPLALEPDEQLKKRIPVECQILMSGSLMEPTIKTDIVLPTADQQAKRILNSAINTEEEKLKQFISLLVINNFMSVNPGESFLASSGSSSTASMAGVATSELLSNQLSHWLSQISRDFDIGLNYRPGDEITNDELEVALSTQILNDRVTINGNLGVGGLETTQTTATTNTNKVVGDFDIDFKITENGKLHLKAFNRANDDFQFQTSPYTQGVGIFYREDFNTLGELMRRYRDAIIRFFSRDEKEGPDQTSMNQTVN